MPISRSWVEKETENLNGEDGDITRFALIVANSPQQMDERLINKILGDEKKSIRILAWASFSCARRVAAHIASKTKNMVCV